MKALFFGVVTLFLIVGMSNDAQAACNAACQARCRAYVRGTPFGTYEQCVAKSSKLNENRAEARRRDPCRSAFWFGETDFAPCYTQACGWCGGVNRAKNPLQKIPPWNRRPLP